MKNPAPTSSIAKLPLARVLALVALLCAGALQVQKANHGHWDPFEEGYSQCLLCQNTSDTSLPTAIISPVSFELAVGPASPVIANPNTCWDVPFLARGPPSHS